MTDTLDPPADAPPAYAPDFVHELFWEQIKRMFVEELTAAGTKMGTVQQITSTGLLVLVDGTSAPRNMPRTAGRRYDIGQRVIVARVQGKPVVVGGVLTAAAGEAVIGTADLMKDAVKDALTRDGVSFAPGDRTLTYLKMVVGGLRGSAVDGDQSIFSAGSIGTRDIGEGQITNAKIADGTIKSAKIDSIAFSKVTGVSVPASAITGRIGSNQIGDVGTGGAGVLGGNIGDNAVGTRNLQEDSVDQRVLANDSVGFQNCTLALQRMIKKAGKGKGKTNDPATGATHENYQPENFPN